MPPGKILCITFTDHAATEMGERVKRELSKQTKGADVTLPTICTLHAYCLRELRRKQWEASRTFIQIIDERHQSEFATISGLSDLNRSNYHSNREEIPLSKVVNGAFTLAQGKKIRFSSYNSKPIRKYWRDKYLDFVDKYLDYKKALNRKGAPDRYLDFNDVLLEARAALLNGEWERPFSLVFVDEVQDLSTFQLDLISLLAGPEGHVCYFGDPQQAIYSFMGARVQKLVSLWKSCGESKRSFRRINYRSPAHIISILNKYCPATDISPPLAVVKTSEMENVAHATRNILQTIKEDMRDSYPDMTGIIHYYNTNAKNGYLPEYNIFYDAGDFFRHHASEGDYRQWKESLNRAVVGKTMATRWETDKVWSVFYSDFTMTEDNYHGVSMFVPQDPSKGNYANFNQEIRKLAWYHAVNPENNN